MALWSNQSSRETTDAMELDIPSKIQASLGTGDVRDKIFHTDIRISSIEDVPRDGTQPSQDPKPTEEPSPCVEDEEGREHAAEMQVWWDESIRRYMNLPDGYQRVAVLIIKWDDELDDLKTRDEAEELDALFSNVFNYHTEIVELNVSSKPQHQISRYLSAFVEKHDGRNNLMIVYYTGHGRYREDLKYLELTGSLKMHQKRGIQNDARANWNKAEEALHSEDIEGDVLTILDTCYSSNMQKSSKEDTRIFESMSACTFDMTTAAPGPNSFTRALIDSLVELHQIYKDRSFTTFHLNQRIMSKPNRRDTPSILWDRRQQHERHIRLAPLPKEEEQVGETPLRPLPRGYLTLRFAIRNDSLNREQIDYLTKTLSSALHNKPSIGLQKIDWLGLKPARTVQIGRAALAIRVIKQWKRYVKRRRQQVSVDNVKLPVSMSFEQTVSAVSSPLRKRSWEGEDSLPKPKKGLLATPSHADPPSPPNSESERMQGINEKEGS